MTIHLTPHRTQDPKPSPTSMRFLRSIASGLFPILLGVSAQGEVWTQQQELNAADPSPSANFGYSLDLDGDTLVIGARADSTIGPDFGSVYVFVRSGGVWTEQQKLTAPDSSDTAHFGSSVGLSGDTIVVGSHEQNDAGTFAGAAYVYVRSGETWSLQQKLTPPSPDFLDVFGISVAIDFDTILVGATGDDDGAAEGGAVYVFTRSGAIWSQQAKLIAPDAASNDSLGFSVAIEGDTALAGAHLDDDGAVDAGSVYVFVRAGNVWTQQAKLNHSDPAPGDDFGISVSLAGDTAAVGAPTKDGVATDSGAAYVFTRSGTVWTQQQKLTPADATANHIFGRTVSVTGDLLVAGAPRDTGAGVANGGSIYVFRRSSGSWMPEQELFSSDAEADDYLGEASALQGDTIVTQAWRNDDGAFEAGSAYVFTSMPSSSVLDWTSFD